MKYKLNMDKIFNEDVNEDNLIKTRINDAGIRTAIKNTTFTVNGSLGEIFGNAREVTKVNFTLEEDRILNIWWNDGGFNEADKEAALQIGLTAGGQTPGNNGVGGRNCQKTLTETYIRIISRHENIDKYIDQYGLSKISGWKDPSKTLKDLYDKISEGKNGVLRLIKLRKEIYDNLIKDDMKSLKETIRRFWCKRISDGVDIRINKNPITFTYHLIPKELTSVNKIIFECELGNCSNNKLKVLRILNYDKLGKRVQNVINEYMYVANITKKKNIKGTPRNKIKY
tara:strand:- start:589 stop:1440 length:852 start_codon:yes stop_codon:yes gene_type:complete